MVLFDTTILTLLLNPDADGPTPEARGRVRQLARELERRREPILVPTPALSELLVALRESGPKALQRLARSAAFRLASFDERAAIEAAVMTREAIDAGDKRGGSDASWQKVKVDRQLVAIARVHGVRLIYTDDRGMRRFAERLGFEVLGTGDMPDPAPITPDLFDDDDAED